MMNTYSLVALGYREYTAIGRSKVTEGVGCRWVLFPLVVLVRVAEY